MDPEHPQEYQFIMSNAPQKKGFKINGNSLKGRIIVSALFLVGAIVTIVVAFAVFGALTAKNYGDVKDVYARQTEILRVIELGLKDTKSGDNRNFMTTIKAVLTTDKSELNSYMKKNKIAITATETNSRRDKDTDKELDTASQNNRYEDELRETLNTLLVSYTKSLRSAVSENETKTGKAVLNNAIENIEVVAGPTTAEAN